MIEIKEVKTKKDWKNFASFPLALYKNEKNYVPALFDDERNLANVKKNFSAVGCTVKAFLCYKDGSLAGRIAGIIVDESNKKWNEKAVRFSRFDFIEDISVASALLDAVKNFGKEQGMTRMHGPWGFNDTDREGLLTFGFDEEGSFATNYNFPYYAEFMEKLGYQTESVWIEERLDMPKSKDDPIYQKYDGLRNFIGQKFGLKELADKMSVKQIVKRYGDKFFDCYNQAYQNLDMYVKVEGDAKKVVLRQFATLVNPKFFSVIVDKNDDVVAFAVVLPSIGRAFKKHDGKLTIPCLIDLFKILKKPEKVELTLVAVTPEYKKIGINAMCIARILESVIDEKVSDVVSDPTLETNTAVRAQWKNIPSVTIKRRQTYTINI